MLSEAFTSKHLILLRIIFYLGLVTSVSWMMGYLLAPIFDRGEGVGMIAQVLLEKFMGPAVVLSALFLVMVYSLKQEGQTVSQEIVWYRWIAFISIGIPLALILYVIFSFGR